MKFLALLLMLLVSIPSEAQLRTLKVEPNHSTIGFDIGIAGFSSVSGKFTEYTLDMDWDMDSLSRSTISASIKASSINTGIADRDVHLQSADFFDVEKYPAIEFLSDSIIRVDHSHFMAYGQFSMHGVSKAIALPFQLIKADGNTIGFSSRTSVLRSDYGVGSSFKHDAMPEFLSDEIQVKIDFWTKKRKVAGR